MANKHYPILGEEVEVTVTFKVKLNSISNYHPLTEGEIKEEIEYAKTKLEEFIEHKVINEYYSEELTETVNGWSFEIEKKEA